MDAAYLDRALVGGRERREILIADYDEVWPRRFSAERSRLAAALGDRALRIEHIGSTAVPGLAAKPIVDILVEVAHLDGADLERAGYVLRVRQEDHRMFRTPELDVHVHVWPSGHRDIAAQLAFRDRLRASPADRAAYETLKRSLAERDWEDMNRYADAKGALIREILARAGLSLSYCGTEHHSTVRQDMTASRPRQGSPFRFEGAVGPDLLIDRRDELATLARRAADRVGVRLAAPRRYGKTSLLVAHAAQLRETGWRTAHVDFGRVSDLTDAARRLAAAYGPLDTDWTRGNLGGLLARLGLSVGTAGASVTVGPRPSAPDPEAAESLLYRLLDLPKALYDRDGVATLVVLDEFQDLLTARADLDGLVRSRIQYHGDAAAYVYAGSEPSMMRELFDLRERPLFGQADPLALGPLPDDEVLVELGRRFAGEDLDPGEALGELAAFAGGHPQRVMMLCYLLAEQLAAGLPGTLETAATVVESAIERSQAAHEALWRQLRRTERVVLAGVADGLAPASPGLAAEHQLGRNTLHEAAERLADQGHLARGARGMRVIDPLLAEWLRRR